MKTDNASVKEILSYIPDEQLDFFAKETLVDWNVKKLSGKELFKLCLFGVLNENRASSRVFESFYENHFFCQYAKIPKGKTVSHSSICDRIGKIDVSYFEKLYNYTVNAFESDLTGKNKTKLCLYDSTITSLSSSLLHFGMKNGQKNKKGEQGKNSLKFTIGFNGLPFKVNFHKDQKMISEDLALGDILAEHVISKKEIAVFDRGMKSRERMVKLVDNQQYFVTRIRKGAKYELQKDSVITPLNFENEHVRLISHKKVHLFCHHKKTKEVFRLVEGEFKADGEPILFLSNLPEDEFSAEQIAGIYKNRWQIEIFFRFIKQEMNFKHYFSREWTGIQVMIYIILIAAILLLSYIKSNKLKGYKIPKIAFCNQLQHEIIQQIIIHCGGDPSKLDTYPK